MLTALSVARECGMVEAKDRVIVINTEVDSFAKDLKLMRKPSISFSLVNKQVRTTATICNLEPAFPETLERYVLYPRKGLKGLVTFLTNGPALMLLV